MKGIAVDEEALRHWPGICQYALNLDVVNRWSLTKAFLDQLFLLPECSMIALQGLCKFAVETSHRSFHFTNKKKNEREFGDPD